MAVIVSNDTYERWVIDPDEGEKQFLVDGVAVTVEDLEEALKTREDGTEPSLDGIILIPNEDARRIRVTYRPLRSFDKHAMQDMVSVSEIGGRVAQGAGRRLQLKRAVVKWDYDVPWSENVLDNLDPALEEQIYQWVSWGIEPVEQNEETGQPIPLPEPTPNRKERRATTAKKKTSSPTIPGDGSTEPVGDDSTS